MKKREPLLTVRFVGHAVESGRMTVDDLSLALKKIQLTVMRLGETLAGQISTAKPGRIRSNVESACALDVTLFESGSFTVGFDLSSHRQIPLMAEQVSLGETAIETMLRGVESLTNEAATLIDEFEYGVLVALRDLAKMMDRGIAHIEFTYRKTQATPRRVRLDDGARDRIAECILGPMKSAVEMRGTLREIDLERRSCQIYRSARDYVDCAFDERHVPLMRELLDQSVIVTGEATMWRDGSVRELNIRDIDIFHEDALSIEEAREAKPSTGKELLAALEATGFIGMWKDREDIADSSKYARQLREQAQKRIRD